MDGTMWIQEFDREVAETRRALERIPDDKLDWRPHPKSWPLGQLAGHTANIPAWVAITFDQDTLDVDQPFDWEAPTTRDGLLAELDKNAEEARRVLEGASANAMGQTWRMIQGGDVVMEMPKGAVLRTFIFNHLIHHRAQVGMYLRLLDLPVPGHYGASADDKEEAEEG